MMFRVQVEHVTCWMNVSVLVQTPQRPIEDRHDGIIIAIEYNSAMGKVTVATTSRLAVLQDGIIPPWRSDETTVIRIEKQKDKWNAQKKKSFHRGGARRQQ